MIVLVTGGRDFCDYSRVEAALHGCLQRWPGLAVVQGGATGADALALRWCLSTGTRCMTVHAPWDHYGKRAGSIRNGWMLELVKVDFVLQFPGGTGTADMVKQANERGILVYAG